MQSETRQLRDLVSIGPAMLSDLELLAIHSVVQLRRRNPARMYRQLCRIKGQVIDPCCLDVFTGVKMSTLPFRLLLTIILIAGAPLGSAFPQQSQKDFARLEKAALD